MKKNKVGVVVLNWKRKNDTLECIDSLFKVDVDDILLTVVIVDNNSSDGSVEAFNKIKSPKNINLKIIENKSNLGFAGGNNVGIKYLLKNNFDYILTLNNDTYVDKKFVVNLVQCAEKHLNSGAVVSKIYFAKGFEFHKNRYKKQDLGNVIWFAGGLIDWDNIYGSNRGVDEIDKKQYDKIEETDFATGACTLYRAKALKQVGLFNEKYFLYLEDVELSIRLKQSNWNVLYCPSSKIWHKVSQSSKIGGELNDYFLTRNRLAFGIKYAKFRTKMALLKESVKFLLNGRKWQKIGVKDFYLNKFYKGSWR